MSLLSMLPHRATIQQAVTGGSVLGRELVDEWTTTATNVPCRLQQLSRRGRPMRPTVTAEDERESSVVHFLPSAVLAPGYRLSQVTTRGGVVLATNLEVDFARQAFGADGQVHHLEVACKQMT